MNGMWKGLRTMGIVVAMAGLAPTAAAVAAAAPVAAVQQEATSYERGRQALNRAQYARAVELFRAYRDADAAGRYAPESMYWEAFALSRMESSANLRAAVDVLRQYGERYPGATTAEDAQALLARVHGELAARGDSESARWVYENTPEASRDAGREAGGRSQDADARSIEEKMAALSALMNMDSERAKPILLRLIRDPESHPELRTQALFMLSQYEGGDVADVMLEVARGDTDPEVRQQAVFWLSQTGSDEALPILEEILRSPSDEALHEQALFAVSQIDDDRARGIIREFARSASADPEMRQNAIFWIGQDDSPESVEFLRDMWEESTDPSVRESILFSMSQIEGAANADWLMDIALDTSEDVDVRKQALFMASQRDDVRAEDIIVLYDRAPDRDIKMQSLFVLSQSDDPAAFDKIVEVARTETDAELRQNAIFWLGQSDDPRVEDVLLEILEN